MEGAAIKGRHPAMQAILIVAERLARSAAPVWITGESGTGKTLLGRHLHLRGERASGPLVGIDCSTAGADAPLAVAACADAAGDAHAWGQVFGRAAGGTLIVDGVEALSDDLRDGLIGAVRAHRRVNGNGAGRAHAPRLIVTSARADGDDLPAALGAVQITLPPLRLRRADIPVLVEHFLHEFGLRHGVGNCRVDTEAMVHLWQYDWPGNVRELESVIERVVVLCRSGLVRAADLPPHLLTRMRGCRLGCRDLAGGVTAPVAPGLRLA